jgi:hypothetical protein
MMLGYAKDNSETLKNAVTYLNNKENLITPKDFTEEFKANQKKGGYQWTRQAQQLKT